MIGTEDLRSEHQGVVRMLDIMDAMVASIRQDGNPNSDDLSQVLEFLRVFVDKCHHTKEEQLLFPAIRAAGMTSAEGVVDALLHEHAEGRHAVSRIAAAADRSAHADDSAGAELVDAMSGYTRLLRAHIVREERDCFDPADQNLTPAVQEQLARGYERIEVEVVGRGLHEGFHRLLDRLSLVYQDRM